MDKAANFSDSPNTTIPEPNKTAYTTEASSEERIAELIQILDNLFDPNNLATNSYLITKSINDKFEIPPKFIYNEWSVRNKTEDRQLINKALSRASNVIVNKTGDYVNSVMPKTVELKRKIVIENIPRDQADILKELVYSFLDNNSQIINYYYNPKLNVANVICRDEEIANNLLKSLVENKFEGKTPQCSLVYENLYQSGVEILNRKAKSYQQSAPQMMPNPAFNPYANYYGYHPGNFYYPTDYYNYYNYYMQSVPYPMYPSQPAPSTTQDRGPNQTGFYKKPYNPNYKNDRRPYVKKTGKHSYQHHQDTEVSYGNKLSTKSSSIEVNENEFPALN